LDSFDLFVYQWSEVAWFGQYGLKIDYDTVKLQKATYYVNFMTLSRLRHRKYVIKMTSQFFPIFKSLP